MEIQGKLIEKMQPQQVVARSTGRTYTKCGFVIETEENYPKKLAFTTLQEETAAMFAGLELNTLVSVTFSAESHSYTDRNGETRWSTDLRCIRVSPVGVQVQPPIAEPPQDIPASRSDALPPDGNEDLPF